MNGDQAEPLGIGMQKFFGSIKPFPPLFPHVNAAPMPRHGLETTTIKSCPVMLISQTRLLDMHSCVPVDSFFFLTCLGIQGHSGGDFETGRG